MDFFWGGGLSCSLAAGEQLRAFPPFTRVPQDTRLHQSPASSAPVPVQLTRCLLKCCWEVGHRERMHMRTFSWTVLSPCQKKRFHPGYSVHSSWVEAVIGCVPEFADSFSRKPSGALWRQKAKLSSGSFRGAEVSFQVSPLLRRHLLFLLDMSHRVPWRKKLSWNPEAPRLNFRISGASVPWLCSQWYCTCTCKWGSPGRWQKGWSPGGQLSDPSHLSRRSPAHRVSSGRTARGDITAEPHGGKLHTTSALCLARESIWNI